MNTIKGLVITTRFDYIENRYGEDALKKLVRKISTKEENYERQPVVGANLYPESTLSLIDEALLKDYFDNQIEEFRKLGQWIAKSFMFKYFNMYIEENSPEEFLQQYSRLRSFLIGTGTMIVDIQDNHNIRIKIDYEQAVPESVRLSELGFIEEGVKICGAQKTTVTKKAVTENSNNFEHEYEIQLT